MIAAVRLRGKVNIPRKVKDALKMLRLEKPNSCIVVPENPVYEGMLEKVKDYVTYGVIDKDTFVELLKKRGRIEGDKPLTEDFLKRATKFSDFLKFADAISDEKIKIKDIKGLKPVFRLNPPRKGMKSIRLPYPKGDLGFRKENMSEFLKRMM